MVVGLRAVLVGRLRVSRMDSIRFPEQLNKPQSTDILAALCMRQFPFTASPQEFTPTMPINVNCLSLYHFLAMLRKVILAFLFL